MSIEDIREARDLIHGSVSVQLKNGLISSVYVSTLYDSSSIGNYEVLQRIIDSLAIIQTKLEDERK